MSDLEKLAERVEALNGPDREVDQAIYYDVLGYCRHDRTERSGAQSDTGFDCLDCGADSWGNLGSKGQRLHDAVPRYTASLDSAVSLVPTDWNVSMRGCNDSWHVVLNRTADGPMQQSFGFARSAALALTAAALRARTPIPSSRREGG